MTGSAPKIYVAGHMGMVGSALVRRLASSGYRNVVARGRDQLDLLDQAAVLRFFREERPDYVFVAAARVGGIHANSTFRAEFIYQNLTMATNLIHGAHLGGVPSLMFFGSSCIYPRNCPQPMREEHLLTGPLEPTNEPYAVAKIAGIKLCEAYRDQYGRDYLSVMPTNLYGPNDNYDLETSHVLPALIRKVHEAKLRGDSEVVVWGSGRPKREFLFVDDLAESCVFLMERQLAAVGEDDAREIPSLVNIGFGVDLTIHELVATVMDVIGYSGDIRFDPGKPDGSPRKLLDSTVINSLGWRPRTPLREGIALSWQDLVARGVGRSSE
jgi:GDP-L-fucose synthase